MFVVNFNIIIESILVVDAIVVDEEGAFLVLILMVEKFVALAPKSK